MQFNRPRVTSVIAAALICCAGPVQSQAQAAVSFAPAHTPSPPTATGRWITESGNLEVQIEPCGDTQCGIVVRVLGNRSMSSSAQELQPADTRPALGMKILTDLRADGDAAWLGAIYNRENAKTYSVRLTMDGPQQLIVRAYVGLPIFGKSQLWRRVEGSAEMSK